MAMKDLSDLLEHLLKDIYYAEKKILQQLPKMAKKAGSDELRQAFEEHAAETEEQIANLEKALDHLELAKRGEKCEAIEGILAEAKSMIDEIEDPETLDAGMVAAAQAVEHYEITRYGTIIAWAKRLDHAEVADLMQANLDQEVAADEKLTGLAERTLNKKAA